MLKRQSKAICLAMALVFCLSFIAVAPPAAQAASATYTALTTPQIHKNDVQNLGAVQVDLTTVAGISSGDTFTLQLPSDIKWDQTSDATYLAAIPINTASSGLRISIPQTINGNNNPNGLYSFTADDPNGLKSANNISIKAKLNLDRNSIDIIFTTPPSPDYGSCAGRFILYLDNANVKSISDGDVTATISGSGTGSVFPMASLVVAKAGSGDTFASVGKVVSIGTGGGETDIITLAETAPGTISANDILKFKLPSGFSWTEDGTALGGWAFSNAGPSGDGKIPYTIDSDNRILLIKMSDVGMTSRGTAGRISFSGTIDVDDNIAKAGDVVLHIYDTTNDVTEQDLTIATYGDYSVKAEEGTKNELVAGKSEQKLGTFYITEALKGSFISGRTVKITLPDGVKWWGGYGDSKREDFNCSCEEGDNSVDITFGTDGGPYTFYDTDRTAKGTIKFKNGATGTSDATKLKFKNLKVDIAPDFSGPLTLTFSGNAGVTGEITVANVSPAVTASCDAPKSVVIGQQDQALGDLTLKEAVKEAIAYNPDYVYNLDNDTAIVDPSQGPCDLVLTLPDGCEWGTGYPTVTVTEGDLVLDTASMSKNGNELTIPVKASSSTASTVVISDMKATLSRTLPEGALKVKVGGLAVDEMTGQYDDKDLPFHDREGLKVAVANVVTPAPTDTEKVGQFNIGSNIYTVNGSPKVMDVAPYIKAGRTYVPVRYLGYALGLTDDQIKWDAATQTVTFTKGSDTVSVVIGSKTLTKNGTVTTMDVAPEIKNGRTMLPARWIAEAFGATVGWNPSTQSVLIQYTVK